MAAALTVSAQTLRPSAALLQRRTTAAAPARGGAVPVVPVIPDNKLTDGVSVTPMTRIRSLFQWLFLVSAVAISVLLAAPAWAAYVIYVQGTNNLLPGTPNVPVSTIFNGAFSNPANFAGSLTVQNVSYPATFGLLNVLSYHGPGLPPTLNQSVAIGVANLDAIIKADQLADPAAQIYVIGYSEGAIVATQEALALGQHPPASYNNVTFILAGNPERAAPSGGGIATQ